MTAQSGIDITCHDLQEEVEESLHVQWEVLENAMQVNTVKSHYSTVE